MCRRCRRRDGQAHCRCNPSIWRRRDAYKWRNRDRRNFADRAKSRDHGGRRLTCSCCLFVQSEGEPAYASYSHSTFTRPTIEPVLYELLLARRRNNARMPSIASARPKWAAQKGGRTMAGARGPGVRSCVLPLAVEAGNVEPVRDTLRLRVERGIAMQHERIVP